MSRRTCPLAMLCSLAAFAGPASAQFALPSVTPPDARPFPYSAPLEFAGEAEEPDEIETDRLLKTLALQTHDSIVALRKRFAGEQKTMRIIVSASAEAQAKQVDKFNKKFTVVNDGGKIGELKHFCRH
jgi:hypothetical protein